MPKRREQVDAGEPAGAVERLVTMLHRLGACRPSIRSARRSSEVLEQRRRRFIGLREEEALAELAAEFAQRGDLLGPLDALGDDLEVEAVCRAR